MGWNPERETLDLLTPEYLAAHPEAEKWAKFRQGEIVVVKGQADPNAARAKFRIVSIGENEMHLVAIGADKMRRDQEIAALKAQLTELEKTASQT